MKDVGDWDIKDVNQWLADLGMGQYIETFQQHAIDGTELVTLSAESLERDLGIGKKTCPHLQNKYSLKEGELSKRRPRV